MSQKSVDINSDESFAGLKADAGFDLVESAIAQQIIQFGRGLGAEAGDVDTVQQPVTDLAVLLFDADFVTGNVITITVNGVATAAVPFNSDHDTTAADVLAAIQGLSPVTSAIISDSPVNREFTIETQGVVISVSEDITGGAGQATGGITLSSDDIFRGISVHSHKEDGFYAINESVSVLRQGKIFVDTSVAVIADEPMFVDIAGGGRKNDKCKF